MTLLAAFLIVMPYAAGITAIFCILGFLAVIFSAFMPSSALAEEGFETADEKFFAEMSFCDEEIEILDPDLISQKVDVIFVEFVDFSYSIVLAIEPVQSKIEAQIIEPVPIVEKQEVKPFIKKVGKGFMLVAKEQKINSFIPSSIAALGALEALAWAQNKK